MQESIETSVSLRAVSRENFEDICDLPLPPEQQDMLAVLAL